MKITKEQLRQIIKEELSAVLAEDDLYEAELPEGSFDIVGTPLDPMVSASVGGKTVSKRGSIAPVIAAVNAHRVRHGTKEGSREETAQNVGNVWTNILGIDSDLIAQGILAGKIRFNMDNQTSRAYRTQERSMRNAR